MAQATIDKATTDKFSWKLFSYSWTGTAPGEHIVVSRVTDANGLVQPTEKDLENKKTFLEDNSHNTGRSWLRDCRRYQFTFITTNVRSSYCSASWIQAFISDEIR